jgi:hypothetical protein
MGWRKQVASDAIFGWFDGTALIDFFSAGKDWRRLSMNDL